MPVLRISFENSPDIIIFDDGQSCCENRFMSTDDDIQSLISSELLKIIAKDGPTEEKGEEDYCSEVHETCFVEIATTQGHITLVTHNEHNGYYGGFDLVVREI